jgi:hypothetical protein
MALDALDFGMGALEGERRPGVVEARRRLRKGHRGEVAGSAGDAQRAIVDVFVARPAGGIERKVRPRLVALAAVAGDRRMAAVEREASFLQMVEALLVEWPDVGVAARVLDVADGALVADVAVNAGPLRDAVGDRLVAGQALLRRHTLAGLMALLAGLEPLELGVGGAQRPR